ncbi:hypothetical protein [Polaromonas sp.]|uniref:hypothetical protein n=1 Tax=Polaromonas sp. TaxID=1869339 RepID=UPI00326528F8
MDSDDVMFSRTGVVGPFGTLTEDAKTKIDFDTMADFRRLCNDAGTDVSGAIRDWVYLKTRGKTYTAFCVHAAEVKAAKLFGEGPVGAPMGEQRK